MARQSGYGSAPAPDAELWMEMKRAGKEIAAEAKGGKKHGYSVNLKSSIVRQLRLALNAGFDEFEVQHHLSDRPSKKDITTWANLKAGEIMRDTSHLRRDNAFWEFGSAVSKGLYATYKKGWSLAAKTTSLTEGSTSIASASSLVPPKYKDNFELYCRTKMRQERHAAMYYLHRVEYQYPPKTEYVGSAFIRDAENPGRMTVQEETRSSELRLSGACMKALMKRGLMHHISLHDAKGNEYVFADLTPSGLATYGQLLDEEIAEAEKYKSSKAYRERAAFIQERYPAHDWANDPFEEHRLNAKKDLEAYLQKLEAQAPAGGSQPDTDSPQSGL